MAPDLFPPLGDELAHDLSRFLDIVDTTFPQSGRFGAALPRDVALLSALLTSKRPARDGTYLGKPAMLHAYLRYFLPWNLYRLSRLLPSLSLPLEKGGAVVDLGSGPLTFPIALWLSRPDTRNLSLEFRCLDRAGAALEAGTKIFSALTGKSPGKNPWKIRCVKAALGARVEGDGAVLVTAANVYNETVQSAARDRGASFSLGRYAEKQARFLAALAPSVLVIEPGVPRAAEFISLLRAALIGCSRYPLLPCTHAGPCPFSGARRPGSKWCHFSFETLGAPSGLLRLSERAGIPKERAVLSFIYAGRDALPAAPYPGKTALRVISDSFPVGLNGPCVTKGQLGRYACSSRGLILIRGAKDRIEAEASGNFLGVPLPEPGERDPKSGALVVNM